MKCPWICQVNRYRLTSTTDSSLRDLTPEELNNYISGGFSKRLIESFDEFHKLINMPTHMQPPGRDAGITGGAV